VRLGKPRQPEALANAGVLENVLDGPQATHAGVEKREQVGDGQVIEVDVPIAVGGLGVEMAELVLDKPQKPATHNLVLRPRHRLDHRQRLVTLASHER